MNLRNYKLAKVATTATIVLLLVTNSFATVFGNVRGVVHDPQHRPLSGAKVSLKATLSAFTASTETNADGLFEFTAVQLGAYSVTVESPGFAPQTQELLLASGGAPVLHYQLVIAATLEQSQRYGSTG